VVFARLVIEADLAAPLDQLIGGAGHGRHHHGDLMARLDLALDVACHVADAVDIGDRASAELHNQATHGDFRRPAELNARTTLWDKRPREMAYTYPYSAGLRAATRLRRPDRSPEEER